MQAIRRAGIYAILRLSAGIGALMGWFLRPISAGRKCALVAHCGYLRDRLPGPLWSAARPGIYEFIRSMYLGTGDTCRVSREIAPNLRMELDVSQKAQRRIFSERTYEASVVAFFTREIHQGDRFIDAGANHGYYTLLASRWVGSQGAVHAFEPEQYNFGRLSENVRANGCTNVSLHRMALGSSPGTLTLHLNPLNEGGHSLRPFEVYSDDNRTWSKEAIQAVFSSRPLEQQVPVAPLSSVLTPDSSRWFLKVDVEGAELEVLRGARDFIREVRPVICCEISEDTDTFREFLKDISYDAWSLSPDGSISSTTQLGSGGNYILKPVV